MCNCFDRYQYRPHLNPSQKQLKRCAAVGITETERETATEIAQSKNQKAKAKAGSKRQALKAAISLCPWLTCFVLKLAMAMKIDLCKKRFRYLLSRVFKLSLIFLEEFWVY